MAEITEGGATEKSGVPGIVNTTVPWTVIIKSSTSEDVLLDGAPVSTQKLEISASVYSLFVYGEWIVALDPSFIENTSIAIGTKLLFSFQPPRESGTEENVVNITLSVLSIRNSSDATATHLGRINVFTLVSPWYFDQISNSHAYKGNVSSIMKKIIDDELSNSFSKVNMITSADPSNSIRYRTGMTPSKFFDFSLKQYMRGNNDSLILSYTNLKNEFEMLDYGEIENKEYYISIDFSHPNLASLQSFINDPIMSTRIIYHNAFTVGLNMSKDKDLWAICNPALYYMYHDGITKTEGDPPVLKFLSSEIEKKYTFVRKESIPSLKTKTYFDDSFVGYEDIYSKILNDYKKRLMDGQLVEVISPINMSVDIGRFCYFYVTTQDDSFPSQFYQKYIITQVSHVFKGIQAQTYVTFGTPAFEYKNESNIAELWHPAVDEEKPNPPLGTLAIPL